MKTLSDLTNEELWQLFPIIISEHKDYWIEKYASEEKLLVDIIGEKNIIRINHIGSTAIPNLLAKPTIDILLEIKEEMNTHWLIETIKSKDYIYTYQPDSPAPNMMFMKGYTSDGFKGQAYHLHIRYSGDWNELYFRDYLIKYPHIAKQYGELKLKLKDQFEYNRDAYTSAKTNFINQITKQARLEFYKKYEL